jgi:hypothetical protein
MSLRIGASIRDVIGEVEIVVVDIRNANDEDSHLAFGAVDDARRDVCEGAFGHRMIDAVENEFTFAFDDVIELGADFVIVGFAAVDIDGMDPALHVFVPFAEETVAPAAETALRTSI